MSYGATDYCRPTYTIMLRSLRQLVDLPAVLLAVGRIVDDVCRGARQGFGRARRDQQRQRALDGLRIHHRAALHVRDRGCVDHVGLVLALLLGVGHVCLSHPSSFWAFALPSLRAAFARVPALP